MQCLYLYLALLPLNHKLVHELAAVYTEAIADIKRSVLRVIEQPVRSIMEGITADEVTSLMDIVARWRRRTLQSVEWCCLRLVIISLNLVT